MPITEYKTLPWQVTCDECGDYIGGEDFGGTMLLDAHAEALERIGEWEWRFAGGVVTCPSCLDEEDLKPKEGSDA